MAGYFCLKCGTLICWEGKDNIPAGTKCERCGEPFSLYGNEGRCPPDDVLEKLYGSRWQKTKQAIEGMWAEDLRPHTSHEMELILLDQAFEHGKDT